MSLQASFGFQLVCLPLVGDDGEVAQEDLAAGLVEALGAGQVGLEVQDAAW